MFGVTDRYQSAELSKVCVLLDKLSESDRERLLKYLICQPMDRMVVGEILKTVADRLTNNTFSSVVNDATLIASSKRNELERKLPLN